MTMGHTLITLSPPNIRNTSTLATFVMNACASQCFGGFMIAFGYSCYGAYLKVDERSKGAAVRFQRVLRTCALPVCMGFPLLQGVCDQAHFGGDLDILQGLWQRAGLFVMLQHQLGGDLHSLGANNKSGPECQATE